MTTTQSGCAASDVLTGSALWSAEQGDALEWLASLPSRCVDAVLTSPPYEAQRSYGIGFGRRGQDWVDWMRPIVVEAARVSRGLVLVNAAGPVKDGSYSPSMEWLASDLTRVDALVCGPSPYCWWKVCGTPGSGAATYQRRDWEPVYAFCLPDRLPLVWSDNTAFGTPPKCKAGGKMSARRPNGERGKKDTRVSDGNIWKSSNYTPPEISNAGNVIQGRVGGGHIGHPLAHEGEAPMSLDLAERFVCWFVPPGGVIADPFGGSGTTAHAAILHGRRAVLCDLRPSQCKLTEKRLATVTPRLFEV